MTSNDWLEFTVQTRWPEPGFVVIDQHGKEHACAPTGRQASAAKAHLVKAQIKRLTREAGQPRRVVFVGRF
jgi:hypothetical protein